MVVLPYWENRQRSTPKGWTVPMELQTRLSGANYSWTNAEGMSFFVERIFHNAATMQHRECQRCSPGAPQETDETAIKHPSMWTLIWSWNSKLLWVMGQIYRDEYVVVPSTFTCTQQDNFMWEL